MLCLLIYSFFFFKKNTFYCVFVFGMEMRYGMCVHQRTYVFVFGVEMCYGMCAHQRTCVFVFGVEMHYDVCAHQRTA